MFQKGNKIGYKHGGCPGGIKTKIYLTWLNLFRRCYDPTDTFFKYYGGRGIQVCARWHKSNPNGFTNFKSDMGERPENHSIDRINNELSYMPSNCRWATRQQQAENKRQPRGENAGNAILDSNDVKRILELRILGLTQLQIHQQIDRKCSLSNVKKILQGGSWSHITGLPHHGRSLSTIRANLARKTPTKQKYA